MDTVQPMRRVSTAFVRRLSAMQAAIASCSMIRARCTSVSPVPIGNAKKLAVRAMVRHAAAASSQGNARMDLATGELLRNSFVVSDGMQGKRLRDVFRVPP